VGNCDAIDNTVGDIRIFSWNPGSFNDPVKQTLAEGIITATRSNVVCLQETWMAREPEIAGLRSVVNRAAKPTRSGHLHRGQWIGASVPMVAANPPLTVREGPEVVWGWSGQYGLLIGNVYLPVQQEWSEEEFFTQLETHRDVAQVIILVGDFNCRRDTILASDSRIGENPRVRTCRGLLDRGFKLLQTGATHRHRTDAEATTIDLVFTWRRPASIDCGEEDLEQELQSETVVTTPVMRDGDGNPSHGHHAIIVTVKVTKMAGYQHFRNDRLTVKGHCLNLAVAMQDKRRRKFARSAFRQSLSLDKNRHRKGSTDDTTIDCQTTRVATSAAKIFETWYAKQLLFDPLYFELRKALAQRRLLRFRLYTSVGPSHIVCNVKRLECNSTRIRKAMSEIANRKTNASAEKMADILRAMTPGSALRDVKRLDGIVRRERQATNLNAVLNPGLLSPEDLQAHAELWKSLWEHQGTCAVGEQIRSFLDGTSDTADWCDSQERASCNARLAHRELEKQLKRMANCRAPGRSGVPTEIFKYAPSFNKRLMARQFTKILLDEAPAPSSWKLCVLVCLFKGGEVEPRNYRPINLGEGASRVLDKVIGSRLGEWIESVSQIQQGGFRRLRGSDLLLFTLRAIIESEPQRDLCLLALDLEKAYDKVAQDMVPWAMAAKGLTRDSCRLIDALNRGISTTCGNDVNFSVKMLRGVKQGGSNSPFQFNATFAHTSPPEHVQQQCGVRLSDLNQIIAELLYADDRLLVSNHIPRLQQLANVVAGNTAAQGHKHNVKKCECMVIRKAVHEEIVGIAPGAEDSDLAANGIRREVRAPIGTGTAHPPPPARQLERQDPPLIAQPAPLSLSRDGQLAARVGAMSLNSDSRDISQQQPAPRRRVGSRELAALMGDLSLDRNQRQARRPSRSPSPMLEAHPIDVHPAQTMPTESPITIDSTPVPYTDQLTYLGMWIKATGTIERKDGIKKFTSSVAFASEIWRKLRAKVPSHLVSRLMFGYCLPVALYGCEVTTATTFEELNVMVNRCARTALGVLPSTRTSLMLEFLGWRSSTLQGQYLRMLGAFRLLRSPHDGYHHAALLDQIFHGRQWLMDTLNVFRQFGPAYPLFVQGIAHWAETRLPAELAQRVLLIPWVHAVGKGDDGITELLASAKTLVKSRIDQEQRRLWHESMREHMPNLQVPLSRICMVGGSFIHKKAKCPGAWALFHIRHCSQSHLQKYPKLRGSTRFCCLCHQKDQLETVDHLLFECTGLHIPQGDRESFHGARQALTCRLPDFEIAAREEGINAWHNIQAKRNDYILWLTGPCPKVWFNTPTHPDNPQDVLAKPTDITSDEIDRIATAALTLVRLRGHYSEKFKSFLRPPRVENPAVLREEDPLPRVDRRQRAALKLEWIRRFHECRSLEEFRECTALLGYPHDFFSKAESTGKQWTTGDLISPNAVYRRLEILSDKYPYVCCFTNESRVIWMKAQPWFSNYKGREAIVADNIRAALTNGALGRSSHGKGPLPWMSNLALPLFSSPLAELYVYAWERGADAQHILDVITAPYVEAYPARRDVWSNKKYHPALTDLAPVITAGLRTGELGSVWSDSGDTGGSDLTTTNRIAWYASLTPSNRRLRVALILGYPPGGSVMVGPTPSLQDLYVTDQAGGRRIARDVMSFLLAERNARSPEALSETTRRFAQWCFESGRETARDSWPAELERLGPTTGIGDE
jgi:hypothetical protein